MAEQLRVFVSHSHQDNAFCQQIVQALRDAGADVWYDEHNLGWGELHEVIQRELGRRAIFVLILSKAVFASKWVKRETMWAYKLYDRDPTRAIVPVTVRKIDAADFDPETGWLFLDDFKRIEAPGYKPFPVKVAANRLIRALSLTPAGEAPTSVTPQPDEDVDDLLTRGQALIAQKKYAEALPLFERAVKLAPGSLDTWSNLSWTLSMLERDEEALVACDRALALGPNHSYAWQHRHRCAVLVTLGRIQEALVACDRALALDPKYAAGWDLRAIVLRALGRTAEAEEAEKHAKELKG